MIIIDIIIDLLSYLSVAENQNSNEKEQRREVQGLGDSASEHHTSVNSNTVIPLHNDYIPESYDPTGLDETEMEYETCDAAEIHASFQESKGIFSRITATIERMEGSSGQAQ